MSLGMSRRSSNSGSGSVEIPEFLRKRPHIYHPRAWHFTFDFVSWKCVHQFILFFSFFLKRFPLFFEFLANLSFSRNCIGKQCIDDLCYPSSCLIRTFALRELLNKNCALSYGSLGNSSLRIILLLISFPLVCKNKWKSLKFRGVFDNLFQRKTQKRFLPQSFELYNNFENLIKMIKCDSIWQKNKFFHHFLKPSWVLYELLFFIIFYQLNFFLSYSCKRDSNL